MSLSVPHNTISQGCREDNANKLRPLRDEQAKFSEDKIAISFCKTVGWWIRMRTNPTSFLTV